MAIRKGGSGDDEFRGIMGRSIEGMSKVDKKAVCCIVKNEERDFAEWIAFHLKAGFDAIIVYDNMSDDRTRDVVLEFTEKFDVRLVKWKQTSQGRQFTAYSNALARFGEDFKWMLFIDSDEFFIESSDSYKKMSFLDNFDASVSQVLLNWVTFGSSGHKEFPDGLVIENFLYRAPEEKDINKHTKAFVRPGDVLLCNHPHQFSVTGRSVDVFGNDIVWSETHGRGIIAGVPDYSGPRIHHYWTRSEAHWLLKDARQRPDSNRPPLGIEAMRAFDAVCTVRDESALPFAPAVRSVLQEARLMKKEKKVRPEVIKKLWRGNDPFDDFPADRYTLDTQGWGSEHSYLAEAIDMIRPRIVVEVGVWKGGSSLTMARRMKDLDLDAVVISIDTWLGSWEHWQNDDWFSLLGLKHGHTALMGVFLNNVIQLDFKDYIIPLPLDSLNAVRVLNHFNIRPDVVHIDGGHDYDAVSADLRVWWEMLNPGGLLIGDDYDPGGGWPDVKRAFDEFFGARGLTPFEHGGNKCRIRKLPPIPEDFDPERYLELNPDVREGGADPARHWQEHGCREGRPYK